MSHSLRPFPIATSITQIKVKGSPHIYPAPCSGCQWLLPPNSVSAYLRRQFRVSDKTTKPYNQGNKSNILPIPKSFHYAGRHSATLLRLLSCGEAFCYTLFIMMRGGIPLHSIYYYAGRHFATLHLLSCGEALRYTPFIILIF